MSTGAMHCPRARNLRGDATYNEFCKPNVSEYKFHSHLEFAEI